jgi:RNase H-fold protein (predicted Holliday junction resolvase)
VDSTGQVHWHDIILTAQVLSTVADLFEHKNFTQVILGDQTRSRYWQQQLQQYLPPGINIQRVDERYSSLEARQRYWQLYPPRGWQRLIPLGLRQPPRPVDDLVAIILVERFLQRLSCSE